MSEWGNAALSDLAEIRISNVDKKSAPLERDVRLCNYMDVYGNDYITADLPFMEASATPAEIDRFGLAKGDVLLTKDSETPDDIGNPAVVVEEISNLVCGYHLALIRPNGNRVDSLYLAKQLAAWPTKKRFSHLANGSTRYGLSFSAIAATRLAVPALREQHGIAEILATLDRAIERTEALIAKYQQIKAGLMHDLFTRGVTPDGRLRPPSAKAPCLYAKSVFGEVPREWKVSNCNTEFTIDSGITLGQHRVPKRAPHQYLRVANVQRDRISTQDVALMEIFPGEIENYRLRTSDLLIVEGHANRSEIGRCAMVLDDAEGMLFQNHLFRLRAKTLTPQYALLWLNSHHSRRYWETNSSSSSGLNTINRRALSG